MLRLSASAEVEWIHKWQFAWHGGFNGFCQEASGDYIVAGSIYQEEPVEEIPTISRLSPWGTVDQSCPEALLFDEEPAYLVNPIFANFEDLSLTPRENPPLVSASNATPTVTEVAVIASPTAVCSSE
jgi:hypothetical protein